MAAARQHKCHSINKKWDRLAIKYIVQEWRPLDSLCGKGLNILVEAMAPHYSLPSHNHVLYNVMCLLTYHEIKSYIKSILLESESIIIFNFIIHNIFMHIFIFTYIYMVSYLKNGQNNGFDNPIFSKCSFVKILLLKVLYYIGLTLYITESSLALAI